LHSIDSIEDENKHTFEENIAEKTEGENEANINTFEGIQTNVFFLNKAGKNEDKEGEKSTTTKKQHNKKLSHLLSKVLRHTAPRFYSIILFLDGIQTNIFLK